MSPEVFINYRKVESSLAANLLNFEFDKKFGEGVSFLDVGSIRGGAEWRDAIFNTIPLCKVMVVLIEDNWHNEINSRELNQETTGDDIARVEISKALNIGMPVLPVLLGRARMPKTRELPEDLKRLTEFQATELRAGKYFKRQLNELINTVAFYLRSYKLGEADNKSIPAAPILKRGQSVTQSDTGLDFNMDFWFITNKEFQEFLVSNEFWKKEGACLEEDKVDNNYLTHWEDENWESIADLPVTNISFFAAAAYGEWRGKAINTPLTLPFIREWEIAARCERDSNWVIDEIVKGNVNHDRSYNNIRGSDEILKQSICNPWGFMDLLGNVYDLCLPEKPEDNLINALGGAFYTSTNNLLSPVTLSLVECRPDVSFRCVSRHKE